MDNFVSVIRSIDEDHECVVVLGGDFNFILNTDLESDAGNPKLKLFSVAAIKRCFIYCSSGKRHN